MSVKSRIEQAPACEVINLMKAEEPLYTGAGWKIARFQDGVLQEFFDPRTIAWRGNTEVTATEAAKAGAAWIAQTQGEHWLVMCSSYQLCAPERVAITDARALAKMAKTFSEQFSQDEG